MGSGDADIYPHQPMIGAGEWEDAHQWEQWISIQGPEDSCALDLQVLPGQHIVRSKITGRAVCEVGSVERRVTSVRSIRSALQCRLLRSARTGRRHLGVDERMIQQLLD